MKTLILLTMLIHPVKDTTPVKITCTYDTTKWKVLPMTHADSVFLKKHFKKF